MFWKDELAQRILSEATLTYKKLLDFQHDYPHVRVKTLDAAGKIPAIQLEGKSEWLKPKEWANDHLRALSAQLLDVQARVATIRGDNVCGMVDTCSLVAQLKEQHSNDLAELNRVREHSTEVEAALERARLQLQRAIESYRNAAQVANDVDYQFEGYREALAKLNSAVKENKFFSL